MKEDITTIKRSDELNKEECKKKKNNNNNNRNINENSGNT